MFQVIPKVMELMFRAIIDRHRIENDRKNLF